MNWLEITGVVAIGLVSLIPLYFVYHILRGAALAFDVTLWLIAVNRKSADPAKITPRVFVKVWSSHVWDLIGYNHDSGVTSYDGRDGSEWRGFGTGR
jgi:hypothetical protein